MCRMYAVLQAMGPMNARWREGISDDATSSAPFRLRPKAHMLHDPVSDHLHTWGSPAGDSAGVWRGVRRQSGDGRGASQAAHDAGDTRPGKTRHPDEPAPLNGARPRHVESPVWLTSARTRSSSRFAR